MTVEESRALVVAINSLRFNPDLSDTEMQSYEMALANMRDRMQEEEARREQEEISKIKSVASWADAVEHELEKYTQAEKEGRIVILPCKLGGTVYANFALRGDYLREKDKPYPCEVVFIGISEEPFMHIQFENGRVFQVSFEKIGKTVFTTREAAEAALREQEG